jgi:hypothetical protein
VVRVHIPGLSGLSLWVAVTTNGQSWSAGVVDTATRAVATHHEVIPSSKIKRVCYMGTGTWLPPDEIRAAVILLSAITGLNNRGLWELAHEGTGLDPRRHLRGRSRKPISVTDSKQEEILNGLTPLSLDREERRRIRLLELSPKLVDEDEKEDDLALVGSRGRGGGFMTRLRGG